MVDFGDKLRNLRTELNKSQAEVATEIERLYPGQIRISQTTLSVLEQRTDPPRRGIVEVLADYFAVPLDYFYSEPLERKRVDMAKDWIEGLKSTDFDAQKAFFHAAGLRENHDDVDESLNKLLEQYDENDEFLDS